MEKAGLVQSRESVLKRQACSIYKSQLWGKLTCSGIQKTALGKSGLHGIQVSVLGKAGLQKNTKVSFGEGWTAV